MNQYSLTVAEARWLCKALSPDRPRRSNGLVAARPALRKALLAHYNGDAVLVAHTRYRLVNGEFEEATE